MRILINGINLELTDGIRQHIEEKIGGLERFNEFVTPTSVVRVEVAIVTKHHKSGPIYRAEANLTVPNKYLLRAESENLDIYQSIDEVRDKLEREIDKYKKSDVSKKHRAALIWKKIKSISPLAWLKNEFRKGKRDKEKF